MGFTFLNPKGVTFTSKPQNLHFQLGFKPSKFKTQIPSTSKVASFSSMASSMATLSRRLCRALLSNPTKPLTASRRPFSTSFTGRDDEEVEEEEEVFEDPSSAGPDPEHEGSPASSQRMVNQVFEDGVEVGVYKAILVGIVGPSPVQKTLKNGMKLTLMTVGTGGIKNNRRPLMNEDPNEYANRSSVLWHRVAVYQPNLGDLIIKNVEPGNMVYVEGNIETKVFTDAITGLVRRVREVALRKNGRFVFLGKGDTVGSSSTETRNAGYY